MNNLLQKLVSADVICNDCGTKYGKYSVGCSSRWMGTCDVCGEIKGVTEVRDYGYLAKGINELKNQKPIMTDEELEKLMSATSNKLFEDDTLNEINNDPLNYAAPYELGEITLKLTEEEVAFLNECLDTIVENHPSICAGHNADNPEDVALFESIEKKIVALYDHHCVRYSLTPAMAAFIEKYNEIPPEGDTRWEIFQDAYNMAIDSKVKL